MNLCELLLRFGDDTKCRAYLEALRWHDKVTCPNCQSEKISRILARNQFDCDSCRYQFSVTAGTIFHDSHLPLTKWFATVYLMCESRKGMSAKQIERMMGISYKTADSHRSRILEKLGVHETASMVRYAIRAGLIEA